MTPADLDRIERALGFALPAFYRRYMQAYPRVLLTLQPEGFKPVDEWEFAEKAERVIEFNVYVREQEEGTFVDDAPWPDEYLVIGNEEDQNYFVINRHGGEETVYFWSHEDGEFHPIVASLKGYADWLVAWWDDIKRDREEQG
jgi:hypothetical protein